MDDIQYMQRYKGQKFGNIFSDAPDFFSAVMKVTNHKVL